MLIYNETFIVDDAIVDEWLAWIKNTILDSPNEGITYCLQFHTDSVERYSDFYYKHMEGIHATHNVQFEERFALFHTLMETVGDF